MCSKKCICAHTWSILTSDITLKNCHCSGYSKIRCMPGRDFLSRSCLTPVQTFRSLFFFFISTMGLCLLTICLVEEEEERRIDSVYFSVVSNVGLFQPDTWRFPDGPPHTSQPLVWYSMVLMFWYLFVRIWPISRSKHSLFCPDSVSDSSACFSFALYSSLQPVKQLPVVRVTDDKKKL